MFELAGLLSISFELSQHQIPKRTMIFGSYMVHMCVSSFIAHRSTSFTFLFHITKEQKKTRICVFLVANALFRNH